jgi:hypothetical protein
VRLATFILAATLGTLAEQPALAQFLSPRDNDFVLIVTTNARRMNASLTQSPQTLVAGARGICQAIQGAGASQAVQDNRQQASAWIQAPDGSTRIQVADMFFRNAVSTYCDGLTQQAYDAVFSAGLNPAPAPAPPAPTTDGEVVYTRFVELATRSGIDLRDHLSYTKEYVLSRAETFCGLLAGGDMTKLTTEITFPPIQSFTETTRDRSRLEVAILQIGTDAFCPTYAPAVGQWRRTYER